MFLCKVGCGTYVGRYESYIDYLPSAFSANKAIPVRLTKHVMYFDVPGERDMKMGIRAPQHRPLNSCDTGRRQSLTFDAGCGQENKRRTNNSGPPQPVDELPEPTGKTKVSRLEETKGAPIC